MIAFRRLSLLFSLMLSISTIGVALARQGKTPSDRIIFSVYRDYSSQHVYSMSLNSDTPHRITRNPIEGSVFAISPDRRWLIFEQTHTHGSYIYRLRISDNRIEQLSPDAAVPSYVLTTPDRQWLILENEFAIFRLDINGGNMIPIVEGIDSPHAVGFSPDGRWLIFTAWSNEQIRQLRMIRVRVDGSELNLVSGPIAGIETESTVYIDRLAGWLDNGEWVVIERTISNFGKFVVRMPFDGSEGELLTTTPGFRVLWQSDDSNTLILSRSVNDHDKEEIFLLDVATRCLTFIRSVTYIPNHQPDASPNGKYVMFVARSASGSDIFRLERSNNQLRQLTDSIDSELSPIWSPDSEWIVFSQSVNDPNSGMNFFKLYKMPADGNGKRPLTRYSGQHEAVNLWLPPIDLKWHPLGLFVTSLLGLGIAVVPKIKRRQPPSTTSTLS